MLPEWKKKKYTEASLHTSSHFKATSEKQQAIPRQAEMSRTSCW